MPLPSALAIVTTSGRMPACSNANHVPVRPRPHCTSSTMSSASRSSHRRRTPCRYSGDAGITPPSPCTASSSTAATRSSSAPSSASRSSNATWRKPRGQGLERLLLLGLAGRGERRERAAVEGAVRADHVVAVGTAVGLAVPAGELDRALVGLGARVGEEDAPVAAEQRVQPFRDDGAARRCNRGSTRAAACAPGRRSRRRPPGARGPSDVTASPDRKSRYSLPALSQSLVPSPRTNATGSRP